MYPNTANSSTSSSCASRNTWQDSFSSTQSPSSGQAARDAQAHQALLSHFPSELQTDIDQAFPTLETLQEFHDELRDNDIPVDRIRPVARMLKASRDAREVERARLAQERELHFHHGSGVDSVNRRNDEGATSLHIAILCYSASKVRQLLASGARLDLEVRPAQRKSTFFAMASLARMLTRIDANCTLNETIINAVNRPLNSATSNVCARVLIEHAGENALTLAISYEAPFEIIEMLVRHCALHCPGLLRQADARGNPPLLLAAASSRRDAVDVARLLLASDASLDVDQTNGLLRTPLIEAVRRGDSAMVKLLLQAGASCYIADNHGYNATDHAVLCEWPALHHLMLEFQRRDATSSQAGNLDDLSLRDFLAAVRRCRSKPDVVRQMLTDHKQRMRGAAAALTVDQQRQLAEFVQLGLLVALQVPNNGAVIRCLTNDCAADADLPDADGLRPWQTATDKEALEALLEVVCKPDAIALVKARSQAMLAEAARHGSIHYACLALDAGADIEAPARRSGRNALMTAVERNDRPLIIELLRRGASMLGNSMPVPGNALATTLTDCALATARDLRPMELANEMVVFIVDNCPDPYLEPHHAGLLLDLALAMKLPALAARLIKDGKLEPRWFEHRANSLLVEIVHAGSTEFAAALLQDSAPLMQLLNADNGNADRALELASSGGKQAIFHRILLACKIDLSTPRDVLSRRLMWAVDVGCTASCQLILTQGGLQLPATAPAAENPLILAVQRQGHELITLLLAHGAHACARHGAKASALSRAIEADDETAVNILLNQDQHPHELAAAFLQLLNKAVAGGKHRAFELLVMKSRELVPGPATLTAMLQHAVTLGSLPACVSLLKRGAAAACTKAESQALLALALKSTRPGLDIVRLLFEIRPRASSADMETYETDIGLDFAEIVRVLAATNANQAHRIEWMALMFCAIRQLPLSTMTDMRILGVGRLFQTLGVDSKRASSEAMITRALHRATELAMSMPDAKDVLQILKRVALILDLRWD